MTSARPSSLANSAPQSDEPPLLVKHAALIACGAIAISILGAVSREPISILIGFAGGFLLAGALAASRLKPLCTGLSAVRAKLSGLPEFQFLQDKASSAFIELPQLVTSLAELLLKERTGHAALGDRYHLLTDNIAAAVVLRDSRDHLVYCSPYTEVLTGYSLRELNELPGDFLLSLVHPDDRERYERALKIGAMGEAFQVRHRILHKTGIEMWVETRTVPILDADGEVSQSLSVTLDVTGAVRYQRQVEEKNRDLHDFAYMVSHDLKGPIMTIKGMLGVLEDDLADVPEDARETILHIRSALTRLEQLVAGVLEYAKISAHGEHAETVDLDSVLGELKHHLSTSLPPNAALDIQSTFPAVVGDHVWLYQVFSNLLGNSVKYRDPSRDLKVSVTWKLAAAGREVVVSITDNGLGIPADKLPLLFRPFQRAHGRQIEGTGIGLASVKRVLEKCGGSVRVESTEGQGSTFFVTLRAAKPGLLRS